MSEISKNILPYSLLNKQKANVSPSTLSKWWEKEGVQREVTVALNESGPPDLTLTASLSQHQHSQDWAVTPELLTNCQARHQELGTLL